MKNFAKATGIGYFKDGMVSDDGYIKGKISIVQPYTDGEVEFNKIFSNITLLADKDLIKRVYREPIEIGLDVVGKIFTFEDELCIKVDDFKMVSSDNINELVSNQIQARIEAKNSTDRHFSTEENISKVYVKKNTKEINELSVIEDVMHPTLEKIVKTTTVTMEDGTNFAVEGCIDVLKDDFSTIYGYIKEEITFKDKQKRLFFNIVGRN